MAFINWIILLREEKCYSDSRLAFWLSLGVSPSDFV